MVLRYTPAARMDLREIQQYISVELKNPQAAKQITTRILNQCSLLKEFPRMGGKLSEKTGRETELYYLVCGAQIAFYTVKEPCVSVIRILDGRTNYLQVLFGAEA